MKDGDGLVRFAGIESVAVVGASDDHGKLRGRLVRNLLQGGFKGSVYPVTQSSKTVSGLPAYRDLSALPTPVDLALVAVPAAHVPAVVEQAAAGAAASLIIFSAGVDLSGYTGRLGPGKLRVLGPNTEGLYLPDHGIAATFAPAIDGLLKDGLPPRRPGRRLFIVSQSGGLGFALFVRGLAAMLNFRGIVTTGNEADVDCMEVVESILAQEEGDPPVIVLVIEGFKEASRMAQIGRRAALAQVPIIVLKAGVSAAGARAAESHTAHLAGRDAAYDAMFERFGIIRVFDLEQLIAASAALSTSPALASRRAAVVTTSGGAGVWAADLCGAEGIDLPQLSDPLQRALQGLVPAFGSTANPVDVTAQAAEGSGEGLYQVAEALLESGEVDCVIVNQGLARPGRIAASREHICRLTRRHEPKPLLFHSHILTSDDNRAELADLGLHAYPTLRACAFALSCLARRAEFAARPPEPVQPAGQATTSLLPDGPLGFHECEALLERYDVPVPASRLVNSQSEAEAVAVGIARPVAMKVISRDILHKTEAGGIALGVAPGDCGRVFGELIDTVSRNAPDAKIDGVQVQEMAPQGLEMAVGIVRDPGFGPLVMVASGGIYIEILGDAVLSPPPITTDIARRMISRLRSYPILAGARGGSPLDIEALAELLVNVGRMASSEAEYLEQLDLNPVRVYAAGKGVLALDSLAVIRRKEAGDGTH